MTVWIPIVQSRYTRPKEMIKTLFSVLYFPRDVRHHRSLSTLKIARSAGCIGRNPLMIPLRGRRAIDEQTRRTFPIENIKEMKYRNGESWRIDLKKR